MEVAFFDACDIVPSTPLVGEGIAGEKEGEWRLAILHHEDIEHQEGLGRADEGRYRMFRIGWILG